MTIVPGGKFLMGSPQDEPGRFDDSRNHDEDDTAGPGGSPVPVTVPTFAIGTYEVSNREFAYFVDDTNYEVPSGCIAWTQRDGKWYQHEPANWRDSGRVYNGDHPVTCVDWYTAVAYVEWLSVKTGMQYRLLSEAEFEYVRRAGSSDAYHFGSNPEEMCRYGNVPDASFAPVTTTKETLACDDGYWGLAPVGQFEPNALGVYDMDGNHWEWLADCYEDSLANIPRDGSPLLKDDCELRSVRGGSWGYSLTVLRSADRGEDPPHEVWDGLGIRVARDIQN
ncbi:MAG: SUMF1/EgtB/PvdO family nonheme iron enzyme [Pseudomonadota bacterium]